MPGAPCPAILHRGALAPLQVYTLLLVCTAPLLICCGTQGSDKSPLLNLELLLLSAGGVLLQGTAVCLGPGLQGPFPHPVAVLCRYGFVGEAARCCACIPSCHRSWGCY